MFDILNTRVNCLSTSAGQRKSKGRRRKVNERWQKFLDAVESRGVYSASDIDPDVTTVVPQNAMETDAFLTPLLEDSPLFVAFDLEYGHPKCDDGKPKPHVDLIQIAHGSNIFLVHLAAFNMSRTSMPCVLQQILESSAIAKVANNIRGDAARLFASHGINLRNCVDLSYVACHVDPSRWPLRVSMTRRLLSPRYWAKAPNYVSDNTRPLSRLAFVYTRHKLPKDSAVEEWHSDKLTQQMYQYALNDAHATLRTYTALTNMATFKAVSSQNYTFNIHEGKPYHIDVSPRKAWKASNPSRKEDIVERHKRFVLEKLLPLRE